MALIVQKFGGTSVGDLERIARAATRVKAALDDGHRVVVVVSAMAGETDRLVSLVAGAGPDYDRREYDAVVASGEQVTSGLMALTLQTMGIPARSWQGWQVPVVTDGGHSRARVTEVRPDNLMAWLDQGVVPVVAGFQGVTEAGPDQHAGTRRLRSLGRRAGRGAFRRALRHLHRCGRCLHQRSPYRCQGAQAR